MDADRVQHYMGYQWLLLEDETLLIGLTEEGLDEFEDITSVDLPSEGEELQPDEVCGAVETDEGPLDIYCPVLGKVIELNSAVLENPSLIKEDPTGDGWLIRVEPANIDDLEEIDWNDDEDGGESEE